MGYICRTNTTRMNRDTRTFIYYLVILLLTAKALASIIYRLEDRIHTSRIEIIFIPFGILLLFYCVNKVNNLVD